MRAIDRKLLRDLVQLRGQVVAVALVVACGVAVVIATRTAYDSLLTAQSGYYARQRFADVFASLERAPEALRTRIASIPGVAAVETRVVADVTLDVSGLPEPATGRLVSLPEGAEPSVNAVHLRAGRLPEPAGRNEVVVSEAFAEAHGLVPGDTLAAVLKGRWERLRVVGVGLSPEYVYEIRPTDLFPDAERFGVLWMGREAMGPAFDMDGAFNDVALRLARDASEPDVIAGLDRLLEPHGGLGAYGREDHVSARFVADEIAQNRVTGTVLPAVFLGVAAFLLHIVLSRLVATQREQIAVLKAFGYRDREVAAHYLALAGAAVGLGAVPGVGLGLWLGSLVNGLYRDYYRFPELPFEVQAPVVVLAVTVAALAAAGGALAAVRRALALPPAEAMRPEPPARFRAGIVERLGMRRWLGPAARMVVRSLARRPVRAGLTVLGLALAVSILILGRFFTDAILVIADVQFRQVQREDVAVTFHEPLPARARHDLAALPGVLEAEAWRAVPARLRFGHRTRRVALTGLAPDAALRRVVGAGGTPRPVPPEGLLLTEHLGQVLGVAPGDRVTVEVLDGERPVRSVPVAGLVDEVLGLSAYMDQRAVARMLREQGSLSGGLLRVDARHEPALLRALKQMPAVAGVSNREAALASFENTLARSLGVFNTILMVFSGVIAAAMVYNAARIALSERARELASLRILGFTRREVTRMLLGEQAILLLLSLPLGLVIGRWLCELLADAYAWDLFRIPLAVSPRSDAFALAVVALAAAGSALLVRARLARLDLVSVLKTRE